MMDRKPRRLIGALASLALVTPICASAVPDQGDPNAEVDALFSEWDTTVSPGCSMAISRNGAIVHARGYGMANLEHGVPNGPRTVFHVASVSKQFTAAAIALLIGEKRIALEDSMRRYLPEMPAFSQGVTVGHLVHHTSGLRDHSDVMELSGWRYYRDLVTTEDAMGVLAKQRTLLFEPGSRYQYSNTNYLLLGEIVQRVTGQSLREFTTQRLFAPLGMKDSFFRDDFHEIVPNFAAGYEPAGDGFRTSLTNFSIVGYSTLLTTVEDLMKWEENAYTGRVGGKALVDLMLTRVPLAGGGPNKYAFGVVVDEHLGSPTVEHSGGDAGYSTHLVRFPERHLSVAVLCNLNSIDARALAMRTAEIHLGLTPKPAPAAPARGTPRLQLTAAALAGKAGRYLDPQTEKALVLTIENGRLLSRAGGAAEELVAVAPDRFRLAAGRWELEFPRAGRAAPRVILHDIYHGSRVLERIADDAAGSMPLEAYTGTFLSEEIEAPFRVLMSGGKLMLRSIKFKTRLTRVTDQLFLADSANVVFERDGGGNISGFRYGERDAPLAVFVKSVD